MRGRPRGAPVGGVAVVVGPEHLPRVDRAPAAKYGWKMRLTAARRGLPPVARGSTPVHPARGIVVRDRWARLAPHPPGPPICTPPDHTSQSRTTIAATVNAPTATTALDQRSRSDRAQRQRGRQDEDHRGQVRDEQHGRALPGRGPVAIPTTATTACTAARPRPPRPSAASRARGAAPAGGDEAPHHEHRRRWPRAPPRPGPPRGQGSHPAPPPPAPAPPPPAPRARPSPDLDASAPTTQAAAAAGRPGGRARGPARAPGPRLPRRSQRLGQDHAGPARGAGAARRRHHGHGPPPGPRLPGLGRAGRGVAAARRPTLLPRSAGRAARRPTPRGAGCGTGPGPRWPSGPPTWSSSRGSGAGSRACRGRADLVVWLEAPEAVRHARAMARDGDAYAPHWRRWAAQEEAYVAAEDPAAAPTSCSARGPAARLCPRRALASTRDR